MWVGLCLGTEGGREGRHRERERERERERDTRPLMVSLAGPGCCLSLTILASFIEKFQLLPSVMVVPAINYHRLKVNFSCVFLFV